MIGSQASSLVFRKGGTDGVKARGELWEDGGLLNGLVCGVVFPPIMLATGA